MVERPCNKASLCDSGALTLKLALSLKSPTRFLLVFKRTFTFSLCPLRLDEDSLTQQQNQPTLRAHRLKPESFLWLSKALNRKAALISLDYRKPN